MMEGHSSEAGAKAKGRAGAKSSKGKTPGQKARRRKSLARPSKLTPAAIQRIFAALSGKGPPARSELNFRDPFELLVAVILSAQATDISVNKATDALYAKHNTPQALLALGEAGLLAYVRTIGLAPTKTRNILKTCRLLLDEYGGEVPESQEALEGLPGVGRKTANVVRNVAFGVPTIAVDTHVFRVGNRTGMAPGKTPEAVEAGLLKRVPEEFKLDAHHNLILHGRYVCKARKPDCPTCIIAQDCAYTEKTTDIHPLP